MSKGRRADEWTNGRTDRQTGWLAGWLTGGQGRWRMRDRSDMDLDAVAGKRRRAAAVAQASLFSFVFGGVAGGVYDNLTPLPIGRGACISGGCGDFFSFFFFSASSPVRRSPVVDKIELVTRLRVCDVARASSLRLPEPILGLARKAGPGPGELSWFYQLKPAVGQWQRPSAGLIVTTWN